MSIIKSNSWLQPLFSPRWAVGTLHIMFFFWLNLVYGSWEAKGCCRVWPFVHSAGLRLTLSCAVQGEAGSLTPTESSLRNEVLLVCSPLQGKTHGGMRSCAQSCWGVNLVGDAGIGVCLWVFLSCFRRWVCCWNWHSSEVLQSSG